MTTIKAIETQYKGYRGRSRLEARWAVFFDALGVKWEYEKEGFDCGEYGYYLPDFYLPECPLWIEVKGQKPTDNEESKAWKVSDGPDTPNLIVGELGAVWHTYYGTADEAFYITVPYTVPLANIIPEDGYSYGWLMRCPVCKDEYTHTGKVEECDGQDNYKAWAGRGDAIKINVWCERGCSWTLVFGSHKGNTFVCIENAKKAIYDPLAAMFGDRPKVDTAINTARAARFEHGETPQIKKTLQRASGDIVKYLPKNELPSWLRKDNE